jgi:hypothetical protein
MLAWASIAPTIEQRGLAAHGAFALADDEQEGELADFAMIALVGLAGRRGWATFSASPEAQDGAADPLDRWSRRVVDGLAAELGARALYPFDGPPHWPFQRWARRAEPMHVSPLGLLIHPIDGLWRGYRGALAFAERLSVPPVRATTSPCETCPARPCLSACPVGAFTGSGYDVAACAAHLSDPAGRGCMERGCLARRACPVGAERVQEPREAAFHMRAFLASRGAD